MSFVKSTPIELTDNNRKKNGMSGNLSIFVWEWVHGIRLLVVHAVTPSFFCDSMCDSESS